MQELAVPVQFFQTVVAIELGITGALLFEIDFFKASDSATRQRPPNVWLRLLIAIVLGATLFGSLDAIVHHGGQTAAVGVTLGVAVSMLPILLRVLRPAAKEATHSRADPDLTITIVGLGIYGALVGATIYFINR